MDRNSYFYIIKITVFRSLSARRAWIEILYQLYDTYAKVVALRKESVDRNSIVSASFRACTTVALRKESVDRNAEDWLNAGCLPVALRKESVDRNRDDWANQR